jgi:hypothetical protein
MSNGASPIDGYCQSKARILRIPQALLLRVDEVIQ